MRSCVVGVKRWCPSFFFVLARLVALLNRVAADRVALLNIRLAIRARARRHARQTLDLLPHSIDAVFYQPDSTGAQIRQAKLTHENFLREYGDAVKGVPLVIYEGRVNRQAKRPFKLAPGK